MRRPPFPRRRRWRAVIALVAVALVAWLLLGAWASRQARAVDVVAVALGHPGWLVWAVDHTTPTPVSAQRTVAGASATVVHPAGSGPWPAVVFVNGATAQGRFEPHVVRLGLGLARAGFLVIVPELPGLRHGQITLRTVDALERVAADVAHMPGASGGRVGFLGVSVGASLALLAAERPALGPHISAVAGLAPYTNLKGMVRLATTGVYERNGRLVRYHTGSFLALALARSLVAGLPPGPQRDALDQQVLAISDNATDPLAQLRADAPAGLGGPAGAAVALIENRSPARFDALWAALPASLRAAARNLSPLYAARRLRFPVFLASSPHDEYFPPSQSEALVARAPGASVEVTSTLDHVLPEPSPGKLDALLHFEDFAVSALAALHGCAGVAGCPR
jgi:pimeloyl-ACP methyl ester carboxylesterase